ncbi:MAG: HAD hydrolase-like protein [Woeseiaceae bacterium]
MPGNVYIDLDGTLTDPYEGISKCICYALERMGFPMPGDAQLRSFVGPPLLDTFTPLVGEELAPKALEHYRERFSDVGWLENIPYDGIHDALAALTEAGNRCFVATTKPHVFARRIVEHFEMAQYFSDVYGSELDGTRTDKTELLEYAQAKRSVKRKSTMIGDRYHDIVGAANNGLRAIGVTYGYGSAEELTAAGAACLAASPQDLPGLV